MRRYLFLFVFPVLCLSCALTKKRLGNDGYKLVWSDEFDQDGRPNPRNWTYETGLVRNDELQWYQADNAFCRNGLLIIQARKEDLSNPNYVRDSKDWRKNRKNIRYTSACLITKGLQSWQYGRFEMRAKIPVANGLWPAFWTLGLKGGWPANGEIDIMEYYEGKILANIASAGKNGKPKWFSQTRSLDSLGGKAWAEKFHTWRMDWNEDAISLFVDNQLINRTWLADLENENTTGLHPFKQPHYLLLNLAIGGMNGGDPSETVFPQHFEVDYVRVYQK